MAILLAVLVLVRKPRSEPAPIVPNLRELGARHAAETP
jgi:hypothetical protein